MSERYPGGFITKAPPTLDPALGNAAPGIWTLDQVTQAIKAGTWPAYDPYFEYVTMLLHGDGTNGAQNNTFLDSSTNNFTITRNGNTTQGTFSPYGDNWSNYFGGSDYINTPSDAKFGVGTGNFTLEAWVYITSLNGSTENNIIGNGSTNGFLLGFFGSSVYLASNASGYTVQITYTMPLNQWVHVAAVRSGTGSGQTAIYINGTSIGTGTFATNVPTGVAVVGGDYRQGTSVTMRGYVSNARISNTARYSSTFTPSTAPLTSDANTLLLTCQSNRFVDNAASPLSITVTGSPSVQRFSPFAPTAAYSAATIGGSGYFDGNGDYLSSPDNTAVEFGSGNFTIEAWAYPLDGGWQLIIAKSPDNSATGWQLFASGDEVNFYASSGGGSWNVGFFTSGAAVKRNAWNHIAVTRSGSTWTIWVNGESKATATSSITINNNTTPVFVGTFSNASYYSYGYVADVRIVKGTAVYTSAFTPPTAPLTAITNTSLLLNYTNAGIIDNAMMNDLETVGNAQISTSVKKYGTGSLAFDGTGDWLAAPSSPNLAFGTGPYTIEFWLYSTTSSGERGVLQTQTASLYGVSVFLDGTTIYIDERTNTYSGSDPRISGSITQNAWVHVAICRQTGTSGTLRAFVNGTQIGSSVTSNLRDLTSTGPVFVGTTAVAANPLNGYIDDLRITKGYARYTAAFTPPTSQLQDQ